MISGRQRTRSPIPALLLILSLAATGRLVQAVWFTIPASGTKCISEEIQANVVVLADYYVVNDEQPVTNLPVSVKVTSPYGNNLYHQENVTHGQFAFTTAEGGNYLACFWHDGPPHQQATPATLSLEWRTGIAAKDWDSVARKEKIEGVELELRKLEGAVEAIHNNLIYLKEREAQMREVNETTNSRVAWYSIMSIGVCIGASVVQLVHLKRYFQKKRLI